MRMKFNKSGQLALVSAASLLVAGLLTACGTLTVDFVYVASSKAAGVNNYGEIDVFEVNSESGRMRQIPTSPFPSGGRDPIAEAVSTDFLNLYVVNQDDNSIVQFAIGNDGKIYPQNTVNTPGVFPLAVATTTANLFVLDTYQPLPTCSPAEPCSGSVAVFPIAAAGSSAPGGKLGTPLANGTINYWPLTLPASPSHVLAPTAIAVSGSGSALYVTAYDSSTSPTTGYVFSFAIGSGGALTPLGSTAVGVQPSAVATDPTGKFVYVTDFVQGVINGLVVEPNGQLGFIAGGPFQAGDQPSSIAVDPGGGYAFVANSLDSTITAYTLDSNSGVLAPAASYATGTQPVALIIDPSTHHYVYTANYLGGTVSGFMLTTTDGPLVLTQNSPYVSNAQPAAMAAIPHGGSAKK
jgi:6-phosphogluconolactonase